MRRTTCCRTRSAAPRTTGPAARGAPRTSPGPVRGGVPAGTPSGRRLRLRGQGLPNQRGDPGDLYAEVRIVVPAPLTGPERDLFEQLRVASVFDPRAPGGVS